MTRQQLDVAIDSLIRHNPRMIPVVVAILESLGSHSLPRWGSVSAEVTVKDGSCVNVKTGVEASQQIKA